MKELANSYKTGDCDSMNVVKAKLALPAKLAPCTAYFKNTEEVWGTTNTKSEYVSYT